MKYCPNCNKNVYPSKRFTGLDMLLVLITGGFYLIWYFIVKSKRCPSCGSPHLHTAQ